MNKIRLLLLIFLIISIGGCTPKGCSFLPKTSLTIIQSHLEKSVDEEGELTAQIEGVARNDGSAKLEYAEVIGKFYSQDGTLLATGVAKTTSEKLPEDEEEKYFTLDPGQIWEFTIPYPESPPEPAYPSLRILGCVFVKNVPIEAKLEGSAQNDGNVTLTFVKLTGHFLGYTDDELTPTGTATTTDLQVGETWNFTIYFPRHNVDLPYDGYVKIEDPDEDLQTAEAAEEVDHATVKVGTLRGSTVMP